MVPKENKLEKEALLFCVKVLRKAEIVCYPTETFYALGIDYFNTEARRRLYELKGRPAEKAFPCIAANREQVESFCDTSHRAFPSLTSRFWPGPLTLVLPLKKHESGGAVAVRVSSHLLARNLAEAFGSLIVSTSANLAGGAPVSNPEQLPLQIANGVSVLINAGIVNGGKPSTIVSLAEDTARILREGAIPNAEIEPFL